jgi:hypothetical protein
VGALGRIAFDAWLRVVERRGGAGRPRPAFAHGAVFRREGLPVLVASYHPSRQNTNTGRLTARMLDEVFAKARSLFVNGEGALSIHGGEKDFQAGLDPFGLASEPLQRGPRQRATTATAISGRSDIIP